jgi:hypothetical protein
MIEKRWDVVGSDGEGLGKVEEILGDSERDIFSGLAVGAGIVGRPREVPAELVAEIVDGSVVLSIGKDEFERLDEYEAERLGN